MPNSPENMKQWVRNDRRTREELLRENASLRAECKKGQRVIQELMEKLRRAYQDHH